MKLPEWVHLMVVLGFVSLFVWARYVDDRHDEIDHREMLRLKSWVWLILALITGVGYALWICARFLVSG